MTVDDALQQATSLLRQGNNNGVVDLLLPLADTNGDPRIFEGLATAYSKLGWWENAEVAAKRVVNIRKGNARAHSNHGLALRKLGRLDEARAEQEMALRLNPGYERAQAELEKVETARTADPPSAPGRSHSGGTAQTCCPRCNVGLLPTDESCMS